MIRPGTSVSTKNRPPSITDSKELQYLAAILNALNNLGGVTAKGAGKTMMIQSTATGNTSIVIPANTWFISIAAKSVNPTETINIGSTPGGSDIVSGLAINNTMYNSINVGMYYQNAQTIYITGATGSVTYNLLTSQ